MADLKLHSVLLMISLLFLMHACTNGESNQQTSVFKQRPELKEIKPQRPVQIKPGPLLHKGRGT